jgi:hypothetical protein
MIVNDELERVFKVAVMPTLWYYLRIRPERPRETTTNFGWNLTNIKRGGILNAQ